MLYMLAGRIFTSIDFIEVENANKAFTSEAKKSDEFENFLKIQILSKKSLKFTFSIHFHYSFTFLVTRRAGWSHPNSKSNTVAGKI